jgi:Trypsin-like peptidase domain
MIMITALLSVSALVVASLPCTSLAQGVIDQGVVRSVVQVLGPIRADGNRSLGSGFLISVGIAGVTTGPLEPTFLVTNKHLIGSYNPSDKDKNLVPEDWIGVAFYTRSIPPTNEIRIPLKDANGKLDTSRCVLDPDPLVDVAVIRVDDVLTKQPAAKGYAKVHVSSLDIDYLHPFSDLPGFYANIGALVFALGYPQGVTSLMTNYPVAKVGHLAAQGGEELAIQSGSVVFRGKLLLIDGLIVPGNSGGPIVLPGVGAQGVDLETGQIKVRISGSSRIIGIVSNKTSPDGLVIAFSSDYVKQLIDIHVQNIRSKTATSPKGR